jgi:membrane protease subunit HflK
MLVQYRKAPKITRDRMYIETMQEVLPNIEKVVIEEDVEDVLKVLPLEKLGGESE